MSSWRQWFQAVWAQAVLLVCHPPPAAKVGAATGFHPGMYGSPPYGPPPMFQQIDPFAAQTEKARVAALNFKNILKPAPKKSAP